MNKLELLESEGNHPLQKTKAKRVLCLDEATLCRSGLNRYESTTLVYPWNRGQLRTSEFVIHPLRIVFSMRYNHRHKESFTLFVELRERCSATRSSNPPLVSQWRAGIYSIMLCLSFCAQVGFTEGVLICGAGLRVGNPFQIGDNMFTQSSTENIARTHMVNSLARIREEWEQAANGNSLVLANASVGLLLADLSTAIGLTPIERVQALGEELVNELQDVLISTPENIVSL